MDETSQDALPALRSNERSPEQRAIDESLRTLLEGAIEGLSESYRCVFVLRDVEGLSTAETADCLGLTEPVVKTRLHRGRAHLRRELAARSAGALGGAFQLHLARCDRVVEAVLRRLAAPPSQTATRDPGASLV